MSDIWAKIESLQKQKLATLSQGKVFTVTEVKDNKVYFVPQSGVGTRRWEPREVFDLLLQQEWVRTDITPTRVAEFYRETYKVDTQNSSYIAAILKTAMKL